jgi:hypothetical protein
MPAGAIAVDRRVMTGRSGEASRNPAIKNQYSEMATFP